MHRFPVTWLTDAKIGGIIYVGSTEVHGELFPEENPDYKEATS